MYTKYTKLKKSLMVVVLLLTIAAFATSNITPALAQGLTVPVNTQLDFNTTMQYTKSFALDKIASMIAKQLLHMMMQSIVTWINSGFSGSPSFIQNPQGFFIDAADKMAAQFISSGPLKLLCSPFALNIQLNLASGQSADPDKNDYECSIEKIIKNVKSGVHVSATVNGTQNGATINDIMNGNILNQPGQLSVNGNSINGLANAASSSANAIANAPSGLDAFTAGDFSQGGWPAFMAMLSEPQNNPYSAYLMAQTELAQKQAAKANSINKDLDRSGGFLSWQDCKSVDSETGAEAVNDPSSGVTQKLGAGGEVSYQNCKTQTPGSVISSSLTKSLGGGQDELVQANDINAIINAAMAQLMSKVLQGGLGSYSSGGSNSSYMRNAVAQSKVVLPTAKTFETASTNLQTNLNDYGQAISTLNSTIAAYNQLKTCFATALTNPNLSPDQQSIATRLPSLIDSTINQTINPMLSDLQGKNTEASRALANFASLTSTSTVVVATTTAVDSFTGTLQDAITNSYSKTAASDLKAAQKLATQNEPTIRQYQQTCTTLQNVAPPAATSTTP